MKLEALTRGVLQSAFNNIAKFTVKHLCWSLFLIKLQAWWSATLSRKKTLAYVFSCKFSEIFKKTYFAEHSQRDAWLKWTKIEFTKSIHRKTPVMASFLVQLQTCGLSFSKKGLHHRCFSMKIGKFYRTSILQINAGRLLLISCDIFNGLLALSVIYQFSHSMEI